MFIITGCGHSATKWMATALSRCGLACTHEQAFPFDLRRARTGLHRGGDVSWCAVPHVAAVDVPVIRLVRHPLAVAASIYRSRFLAGDNPATRYVAHHRPEITEIKDHCARVAAYVADWDRPVAAAPTVRAEDGPDALRAVCEIVGHDVDEETIGEVCAELGTTLNTHPGSRRHEGWESVLRERVAELGYEDAPCGA